MKKDKIIEDLESTKSRMSEYNHIELQDTVAITNALIYIVEMLGRETTIDVKTAGVPDKKPEKKPAKKRNAIDYGKIAALYRAGWSQKKIGEEIGVSQNAISVALIKYRKNLEDGLIWDSERREFIKKE